MGARLSASTLSVAPAGEPVPPLPPLTATPPPLPPTSPVPPPPPTSPAPETSVELKNPGEFEELGKKMKEQLYPMCIEGAKVVIQKGLSNNLQTAHTVILGPSKLSPRWQYAATYVGTNKIGENDFRPVMIGDITTDGSFTSLLLHQVGPWKLKLNAQTLKSQWVGYQSSVDYAGSDFTASATLANPNVLDGSGVLVCQYFQALTKRLSVGTEMMYQRAGEMQGGMLTLGGCYTAPMWEAVARVGVSAWNMNYQHKLLEDCLVAYADLEGSIMQNETCASIGYKMDIGSMAVRGKVNSQGVVSVSLEKRLDPLPGMLTLSGQLNHWTDESKFGISVVVG